MQLCCITFICTQLYSNCKSKECANEFLLVDNNHKNKHTWQSIDKQTITIDRLFIYTDRASMTGVLPFNNHYYVESWRHKKCLCFSVLTFSRFHIFKTTNITSLILNRWWEIQVVKNISFSSKYMYLNCSNVLIQYVCTGTGERKEGVRGSPTGGAGRRKGVGMWRPPVWETLSYAK